MKEPLPSLGRKAPKKAKRPIEPNELTKVKTPITQNLHP
jgi:hypothetical protein